MVSVSDAECHHAECRYAECRGTIIYSSKNYILLELLMLRYHLYFIEYFSFSWERRVRLF